MNRLSFGSLFCGQEAVTATGMRVALNSHRRARALFDFEVERVLQEEPELGIGVEGASPVVGQDRR